MYLTPRLEFIFSQLFWEYMESTSMRWAKGLFFFSWNFTLQLFNIQSHHPCIKMSSLFFPLKTKVCEVKYLFLFYSKTNTLTLTRERNQKHHMDSLWRGGNHHSIVWNHRLLFMNQRAECHPHNLQREVYGVLQYGLKMRYA